MMTTQTSFSPRDRERLSFAQQRLWLLDRLLREPWVYNSAQVLRLEGTLDCSALFAALNEIVRRHEILRTRIEVIDGEPWQVIDPESNIESVIDDLTGLPQTARESEACRRAEEEAHKPFDLARGPVLRARLLRLAENEHWLLLARHHIVSDRWSMRVLADEISALYASNLLGEPPALAALPVQYADYARWQREWLQGQVLENHLDYWRRRLAGQQPIELPADRLRPTVASFRGGRIPIEIDTDLTNALEQLSRRETSTLFMTLLASFQVLLGRYSGQDDITVGVPIAGRRRPELEALIGCFVNTLVMRGDLSGDPSFRDLLARTRTHVLEALDHQDLPFEKLVEEIAPARDLSRNPLFQVVFALQNTPPLRWSLPGIRVQPLEHIAIEGAKFDLTLAIEKSDGALSGRLEYATDLFDRRSIERMAEQWRTLLAEVVANPDRPVSRLKLLDDATRHRILVEWKAVDPGDPATAVRSSPASYGQRALWVLGRMLPDDAVYNEPSTLRLKGMLDVPALTRAINEIVRRHEALRTRFRLVDGEPVQEIAPELKLALETVDLTALSEADREAEAQRRAVAAARVRFDLERGPLIRVGLLRLAPSEHWLLITRHHIIRDGRSDAIFAHELSALYRAYLHGEASPLAELAMQYADYAKDEHEQLRGDALTAQLAYWKRALADLPTLDLPTDRPRPQVPSCRGRRVSFELAEDLVSGLRQLAHNEQTTLFTVLLAALQVLLSRYSGQQDVAVGVPVAGRSSPALMPVIGYFANLLVLRGDLSGNPTFREYLAQTRQRTKEAYANQDLPFARLVEELAPRRDMSRNPLFQVSLNKVTGLRSAPDLEGLAVEWIKTRGTETAKFDLHFLVAEEGAKLDAAIDYATDLFDAGTIERIAQQWRTLLTDVVADPDRPLSRIRLDDEVRRSILPSERASSSSEVQVASLAALFSVQARRSPDAIAIADGERNIDYAALDRWSSALARQLRASGVMAGGRIGVCIERSIEEIVALLAVLKAGCAYVPLDPSHPPERVAALLADAEATAVVAVPASLRALAAARTASARPVLSVNDDDAKVVANDFTEELPSASGEDPAYVMYTSGSTGTPKGVVAAQRGVVRLVRDSDYVQLGPADVVAHLSNPAFDAATFEIWGALLNGACLAVLPLETVLSAPALAAALDRHGVTTLFLTTSLFNQIARGAPQAFTQRQVLFGGEACDPRSVAAALLEGCPRRLLHVYGPTEATTFATWHEVRNVEADALTVPIGKPLANTEVYILDAHREPVPPGVPSEIWIGGPGLALGYLNQPQLTAERFLPHPFASDRNARLYRTGDRARYRDDGTIEFLGRFDSQVKIRGHRVEPAEVEAALLRLPELREAVVLVHGAGSDTRRLSAYVVAAEGKRPAPAELLLQLRQILPAYLVPTSLVLLESLPLTTGGKIDRRALPDPVELVEQKAPAIRPGTFLEHTLASIWERLLGLRRVSVRDSFFDLGGHSLLAAQMMEAVENACGVRLPLMTLFTAPTIEQLAALIRIGVSPPAPLTALNAGGSRPPLFFLHGDFYESGLYCRGLAGALGPDQPFYVVHPHGLDGTDVPASIEEMAADRIKALQSERPRGPYFLGGHCNGALVAVEIARQLMAAGEEVPIVVVIDGVARAVFVEIFAGAPRAESGRRSREAEAASPAQLRVMDLMELYKSAVMRYVPKRFPGRIAVLRSGGIRDVRPDLGWQALAAQVQTYSIPGGHLPALTRHVATTGACVKACLDEASSSSASR